MTLEISGGTIVTPSQTISDGRIVVEGGTIDTIEQGPGDATNSHVLDATDAYVLPGLVDLHGDDIESHLHPRSNANIDPTLALNAADRVNVCHGITTKFHAIAFEDSPQENRSIERASEVADAIESTQTLIGDNRLHARCEVASPRFAEIREIVGNLDVELLSIMHHEPGSGQYASEAEFKAKYTSDSHPDRNDIDRLMESRSRLQSSEQERRIEMLSELTCEYGIPLASHDDESPERVEHMAEFGVTVSEYPLTVEAARRAKELDLVVAMGAPNLVNGGSLWGNLAAEQAIEDGCVDVLCSDYHPASLLASIFIETGEPIYERVARVSATPASAVGLDDRGRLQPGCRADILVVDPDPVPTVRTAIIDGDIRLKAEPPQTKVLADA